jgi:hypothetical protein
MSRITTRLLRWSITSALVLTTLISTLVSAGLVRAAESDTPSGEVAGASASAAAQVQPSSSSRTRIDLTATCSLSSPCMMGRTSDGWELDYGGPGLYFERSSAD